MFGFAEGYTLKRRRHGGVQRTTLEIRVPSAKSVVRRAREEATRFRMRFGRE